MDHDATVKGVGVALADGAQQPVVLLEAADQVVPIFIGVAQAQSIAMAQRGEPPPRPLTHDLLVEMVTEIGGAFDRVRIDDLEDGTFFAKVDLDFYHGENVERFVFDARPSDGIALAIRMDCPISITEGVVEQAGVDPDEVGKEDTGSSTDRFRLDDDDTLE